VVDNLSYTVYDRWSRRDAGVYFFGECFQVFIEGCRGDWKVMPGLFEVVTGKKYFDIDTVTFKFPKIKENMVKEKRDSCFYHFGFSFGHAAFVYKKCNGSMNGAMSRQFKLKEPESKKDQDEVGNLKLLFPDNDYSLGNSFHEALIANQRKFYLENSDDICRIWDEQIGRHEYEFDTSEGAVLLTLEAHQKMLLRQARYKQVEIEGRIARRTYFDFVTWFLKCPEYAKYGKYGRIVVDVTTEGSLIRVHFANSWKKFTNGKVLVFGRFRCWYQGDQNYFDILGMFERHLNHTDEILVTNSSDDGLMTWWDSFERFTYLIDISTNDSGHGTFSHLHFTKLCGMSIDQADNYMQTVSSIVRVYDEDKRNFFELQPLTLYLPSGLGDTTVKNNPVYPDLAYIVNKLLERGYKMCIALVTCAGFIMGHRFSYQRVERIEELQFLKQSPFYLNGKLEHMVNLGVLFRYSGKCVNQLPDISYPKMFDTHELKCLYFQSLLTFGFFKYNRYYPVLKHLCPYFEYILGAEWEHTEQLIIASPKHFDILKSQDRPVLFHTTESFYARYSLTLNQIDVFESLLVSTGLGSCIFCELVDVVLEADYGYSW